MPSPACGTGASRTPLWPAAYALAVPPLRPRRPALFLLALVAVVNACGTSDSTTRPTTTVPVPATTPGGPSAVCADSFKRGHDRERAGVATPRAFLPSVRLCRSLEEWTAAAKAFGVDLKGREAEFVNNTCGAGDADVQSSRICRQAKSAATGAS